MNLLWLLPGWLRERAVLRRVCRHADCPNHVGPHQLLCTEHQILEHLDTRVTDRLWPSLIPSTVNERPTP